MPDDNFEQALIDLGHDILPLDNYVPTSNISSILNLDIGSKNINDLTGIEDFISLKSLLCDNNQLTSLNFEQNKDLEQLWCYSNQLTSLDVTQNKDLTIFSCYNNELSTLNINQNTALRQLWCYNNQLTLLDLRQNEDLILLSCHNNNLNYLDISQNQDLIEIWCNNNNLSVLNLQNGNNSNFVNFKANNNPNLTCIQVDDVQYSIDNWINSVDNPASFNEECYTYIADEKFEQALINLGILTINSQH